MVEYKNEWINKIARARDYHKKLWAKTGMEAQKIYENSDKTKPVYNPVLSNVVNVQQGSIVTKTPDAVVSSTNDLSYTDDTIAQVYEKCLKIYADDSDLGFQGIQATKDYLTSALGVIRCDKFESEDLTWSHVSWKDIVFQPCLDFRKDCGWVAFRHYISKEDMVKEYDCTINKAYEDESELIWYEVWSKKDGLIYHVSNAVDVDSLKDPFKPTYKHKNFYNITLPILMDKKSDEFIPVVEFKKWEKLHTIVNRLSEREDALVANIKAFNVYDNSAFDEVIDLETAEDNEFIPANGDKIRNQNGSLDLSKILTSVDNTNTVNTLAQLVTYKDQTLAKIYQITGISNEMQQGIADLKETATSSRIKQGWGNSRLEVKRRAVHRMLKECYFLGSEIMQQMDQMELIQMSGVQVSPEEAQEFVAYVANGLSEYTFDVETSTSIAIDESEEQGNKLKFIEAMASFSTQMMQSVQSNMIPYSAYVSMLKMVSSTFPNGRLLNDEFEQMAKNNDQLTQMQQQLQELQGQLQQATQENQAMQFELSRRSEADMLKVEAEAKLKEAQTLKTDVETVQKAAEQVVTPDMVYDEMSVINQFPQSNQIAPIQ